MCLLTAAPPRPASLSRRSHARRRRSTWGTGYRQLTSSESSIPLRVSLLDSYVLARQRNRRRAYQGRRNHVVLHYGRLPVRLLLAGEYRAFHQGRRGRTVGDVKVPLGTTDFSGALLQARASGAKVVGFANADADLQNCIKQSAEFGIVKGGQELATLLMFVTDVVALGQDVREGLMLTNSFYWDLTPKTRAWTERFVNLPCSAPRDVIGRRAPP